MPKLDNSKLHLLRAMEGWLELGNVAEAEREIQPLVEDFHLCPEVISAQWQICAHKEDWAEGARVANTLAKVAPGQSSGWIHRSYALHELRRTQEAYDLLKPAFEIFPHEWVIPYNLACYLCQLGRLTEAEVLLSVALDRGQGEARNAAQDDPDLEVLRKNCRKDL